MNGDFMNELRKDPSPEFKQRLRGRLRSQGPAEAGAEGDGGRRMRRPALAVAAAAAVVVAFSVSPPLRASAQAFLDLFRVRSFVTVTVDPQRLDQLRAAKIDLKSLLGDRVEELEKAGPPRVFTDVPAAAAAAGVTLRLPAALPAGLVPDTVEVRGASVARVTVAARRLQELLGTLGMADVRLPAGLDGAQATVRVPAAVAIRYRHGTQVAMLLQAQSPEVDLPTGLDLRQLGEIGLRVLGLSEAEARRFAATIDWRSTVLVPVPANASTFREVEVGGQRGILVTSHGAPEGTGAHGRRGTVVMWSEGGRVYAVAGNIPGEDLLLMAGSLR
jgi:hypothetical protein